MLSRDKKNKFLIQIFVKTKITEKDHEKQFREKVSPLKIPYLRNTYLL